MTGKTTLWRHPGHLIWILAAYVPLLWEMMIPFTGDQKTYIAIAMEMRERVIDAIAAFVNDTGELVVVTRGREDDEEPVELPWPLSRKDLSRFETHGLEQTDFRIIDGDEDPPIPRFVVQYRMSEAELVR